MGSPWPRTHLANAATGAGAERHVRGLGLFADTALLKPALRAERLAVTPEVVHIVASDEWRPHQRALGHVQVTDHCIAANSLPACVRAGWQSLHGT